ncbi:hypothetical protein [Microbacterium sp. H6]|uniref:hypothetical protein n=1 Tax=Microbacterium sp. H6 TaxID=421122 RepID=UPI0015F124C4|nr:hypothetical protein [Microbacterium sp. H6]
MTEPEFAPPVPAVAAIDAPLTVRRATMTRASLIANIVVACSCIAIIAMGAAYRLAGMP